MTTMTRFTCEESLIPRQITPVRISTITAATRLCPSPYAQSGRTMPISFRHVCEVARPADCHDGAGAERQLENEIPTDDPRNQLTQAGVGERVRGPGHRHRARELGVTQCGERAGDARNNEGDRDGRPGLDAGGLAGEHEDAGTDHHPHPEHDQVDGSSCLRSWCVGSSVSDIDCSMVFVRHIFIGTSRWVTKANRVGADGRIDKHVAPHEPARQFGATGPAYDLGFLSPAANRTRVHAPDVVGGGAPAWWPGAGETGSSCWARSRPWRPSGPTPADTSRARPGADEQEAINRRRLARPRSGRRRRLGALLAATTDMVAVMPTPWMSAPNTVDGPRTTGSSQSPRSTSPSPCPQWSSVGATPRAHRGESGVQRCEGDARLHPGQRCAEAEWTPCPRARWRPAAGSRRTSPRPRRRGVLVRAGGDDDLAEVGDDDRVVDGPSMASSGMSSRDRPVQRRHSSMPAAPARGLPPARRWSGCLSRATVALPIGGGGLVPGDHSWNMVDSSSRSVSAPSWSPTMTSW